MTTPQAAELTIETLLDAIEVELQLATDVFDPGVNGDLYEMVAYHHGWKGDNPRGGGKRVRPLLTLLTCAAAGGRWQSALPAAAGIELIHNFSLLHDDIEDRSDTRRGRQTVWKRWGLAQGLNAGDAIFVLARLATYRLSSLGTSAGDTVKIQRALDEACLELTKGQYLDIAFETREFVSDAEYRTMIEGKTAALIGAAASVGAMVAGGDAKVTDAYRQFGRTLGLAFQVRDDILGIWGDPAVTGKPAGDDLRSHKHTLPVLIGLRVSPAFSSSWQARRSDEASVLQQAATLEAAGVRSLCEEEASVLSQKASDALDRASPREPAASLLRQLMQQLAGRQH